MIRLVLHSDAAPPVLRETVLGNLMKKNANVIL